MNRRPGFPAPFRSALPLFLLWLLLCGAWGCLPQAQRTQQGLAALEGPETNPYSPAHRAPFILQGSEKDGELAWYNGKWAHELSDLQPDQKVRFGRLSNGFRYALIPNKRPEGRVAMYLDVQAGSLMEEEGELGYAHYVEHLAFEGSRNFPRGTLIPFFKEHGMSFGGDSNAYTSLAETVYTLQLAGGGQDALNTGLEVLRDFADGIFFEPASVEQERGVILSEMTARDSEAYQAAREQQRVLYAGTRFIHDIIGTEATIKGATSAKLRAFYEKWYRPERMVLILAGDFNPQLAEPLIRQSFESLTAKGQAPRLESFGQVSLKDLLAFYQPRETSSTEVEMLIYHPRLHFKDSQAKRRQDLVDSLVAICLNLRLEERKDRDPGVWQSAGFGNNWRSGLLPHISVSAETSGEGWAKALTALNHEVRSARQYGLQESELKRAKEMLQEAFEGAAKEEEGLDSTYLATLLLDSVNSDLVFTSSAEDLRIYKRLISGIGLEDLNLALESSLDADNLIIYVSGNAQIPGAENEILDVWELAEGIEAAPYEQLKEPEFPYLPLPDAPAQKPQPEKSPLAPGLTDLQLHAATLENGVELYLIPSDYDKDRVQVSFLFGPGTLTLPDEDYPLMRMSEAVLAESGVGRLSLAETNLLFAGRGLSLGESYSAMSAAIYGSSSKKDLPLLLQSVWTQYLDPHPTEAGRQSVIESLALSRNQRQGTVDGLSAREGSRFFNGSARRFSPLEEDEARAVSLEQISSFVEKTRAYGPVRVVISGDFQLTPALNECARLFGSFNELESLGERKAPKPVFPAGRSKEILVPDQVDKAVIRVAWRRDLKDPADRPAYTARQILAQILEDRLLEELRVNMGATYSPAAAYSVSIHDGGYGYLEAMVTADSQTADSCLKAMEKVAAALAKNGVGEEELELARKPVRTALRTGYQQPDTWHGLLVSQLRSGYPYLEWTKSKQENLDALSAQGLSREASAMFRDRYKAVLVVKTKK